MKWFIAILALLSSLAVASIAGWFSIVGIMAIFAGAAVPAAIMAGVLEVAKLVTAAWLKNNWNTTGFAMKSYLTASVLILMFITSMGIFGFLSKAHIEQSAPVSDNSAKIERLDQRISREQQRIDDSQTLIDQLDAQVNTLIEFDKISGPDGSRAVRERQEPQRQELRQIIMNAESNIEKFLDEKFYLSQELREFEVEVGPLKYIAELIYEDASSKLEDTVRYVIIIFIFVFDPLAVLLLIAANQNFIELTRESRKKAEKKVDKAAEICENTNRAHVSVEADQKLVPESTGISTGAEDDRNTEERGRHGGSQYDFSASGRVFESYAGRPSDGQDSVQSGRQDVVSERQKEEVLPEEANSTESPQQLEKAGDGSDGQSIVNSPIAEKARKRLAKTKDQAGEEGFSIKGRPIVK